MILKCIYNLSSNNNNNKDNKNDNDKSFEVKSNVKIKLSS
jgi:hypothetical protein